MVKKCNEKEMLSIMLSRRIQLHFHFMYFIPIEFSNAKNTLNYVFVLSKWNFESWYATKYRYFNKTYMITFLHLKMGKSLHESETSNDNDIVYGVLVEILLELIIQNRAREKKENLCERNPNKQSSPPPIRQTYICAWASVWFYAQKCCLQWI